MYDKLDSALIEAYKKPDLAIFARQVSLAGKRRWFVLRPSEFFNFYEKIPENERKFFEVLKTKNCLKLYFDIEYLKDKLNQNFGSDSEFINKLTRQIVININKCFETSDKRKISEQDVIILDSCNPGKFSYHLICPTIVLSLENINKLVRQVADKLLESGLHCLSLQDNKIVKKSLIDLNVYHENQNMRLIGSSKLGKDTILRKIINGREVKLTEEAFSLCLITTTQTRLMSEAEDSTIKKTCSIRGSVPKKISPQNDDFFKKHLKCSEEEFKKKIVTIPDLQAENRGSLIIKVFENQRSDCPIVLIKSKCSKFQFCRAIKAWHKSYHVYWIIHVKKMIMYQKCFDLGCKTYRGPDINLKHLF